MEAEAYLTEGYGIRLSIQARVGWLTIDQLAQVWQPSRLKGVMVDPHLGTPFLAATQVFHTRPVPRRWLALARTDHAALRFVRQGTILVTCSGLVGRGTLAYGPHLDTLITHDLLRVEPYEPKNWGWIYAYVRAPKVRAMMRSAQYGHVVKHLEVGHLNSLPVPNITDAELEGFNAKAKRIIELREDAFATTVESEAYFETSIGAFKAPESGHTGFEVNAAEAFFNGRHRMEAEYHNPLVRAINRHLHKDDRQFSTVGENFDVWIPARFKRIPAKDGVELLDSSALFEINPAIEKRIADGAFGDPYKGRVESGWVLLARSGQVYGLNGSLVQSSERTANKVISDDIIRIAPKKGGSMRSGYLLVALSHPILGRPRVKSLAYGSSVPHIDPKDFVELLIPRLQKEHEDHIADLTDKATSLNSEADILENELAAKAEDILNRFIAGDVAEEKRDVRSEFVRLSEKWERERPHGSDVAEMIEHEAYQQIIKMGRDVVPLILEELSRKPAHWFWALHVITGTDPVPPENQGRIEDMAAAWIAWGKQQGYRW